MTASLLISQEFDRYEIDVIRKYTKCPSINVNQDGMTQVIFNLFSNAIEAMEKGGTLTIDTDFSDETETTSIRIQDTGPRYLSKRCAKSL